MDPVEETPVEETPAADKTSVVENEDDGLELTPEQRKQLKEDEDFILNFKDEDANDPAKVARLEKIQADANVLKTAIHQKNHFKTKLGKAGGGAAPAPKPAAKPSAPAAPAAGTEDERWNKSAVTDFRLDNPSIPKDVVDSIVRFAKANNMKLDEAAADPVMKEIISKKKIATDVEDASISPSGRKPASPIASRDWSNASKAEIEAERLRMTGQAG